MPRVVVPVDQLPPTSSSAQHVVRFRIISEDRNRISDWSPIFVLESIGQIPSASVSYKLVETGSTPKILTLVWDGDYVSYHKNLDSNQHDVFVSWNQGQYEYLGREVGNSFQVKAPSGVNRAQFFVQMASYNSLHPPSIEPVKNDLLKIVETALYNI
jgi:hypothetical protein